MKYTFFFDITIKSARWMRFRISLYNFLTYFAIFPFIFLNDGGGPVLTSLCFFESTKIHKKDLT